MPIEKAFEIKAQPAVIYEALERELEDSAEEEGSGKAFEILERVPPRSISLRVTIAGMPCWLTYRLIPRGDATEVAATLQPFGMRYALFRIMTLGMRDQNFAVPLVEGLVNLKAAVEGTAPPDDDEEFVLIDE